MTILANINVGTTPNDGTGSSIRDSFIIVNENFQAIGQFLPNTLESNLTANITSTGQSAFNVLTASSIASTSIQGNLAGNVIGNIIGNVTGSTVSAATIGNTGTVLTGTLSTSAQPNITSVGQLDDLSLSGNLDFSFAKYITGERLNLANVTYIRRTVFSGIVASNIALNFAPNNSQVSSLTTNTNISVSFINMLSGSQIYTAITNTSGSPITVSLPTTKTNKGTGNILVGASITASFQCFSFDTTASNVTVIVSNV
jgi:hypothetical protein